MQEQQIQQQKESTSLPSSYLQKTHPSFRFDPNCTKCQLGEKQQERNSREETKFCSYAVLGAGPDDLSKVKLILISDHNGAYECREDIMHPMYDNQILGSDRKRGLLKDLNAGAFIRLALTSMYGLDTYTDMWITNAIKCNPAEVTATDMHVKLCASTWLSAELHVLDKYCPNVPILVAGNKAFKALKLIYKTFKEESLNDCRRRTDIRINGRPAVFTYNPAIPARCMPNIETSVKVIRGKTTVTYNERLMPPIRGGALHIYIDDLRCLAQFLCNN